MKKAGGNVPPALPDRETRSFFAAVARGGLS
jgi:hypothetical protein